MNKTKLRAYSVHIYTTIGIVCGFFALAAVYEENLKDAFFYLGLALFIDGTDGFLARRFEVTKYAPRIDGVILDAIVDYFNYVILPVIIIIKFQFLPSAISYPICILILAASCYTFANVKQKTNLEEFLTQFSQGSITTEYVINNSLVGGFIAKIGDRILDASIKTRLKQLNQSLKN